jgi:hypothetical protein
MEHFILDTELFWVFIYFIYNGFITCPLLLEAVGIVVPARNTIEFNTMCLSNISFCSLLFSLKLNTL